MTGGNALATKTKGAVTVEMTWEEVDLTPSLPKENPVGLKDGERASRVREAIEWMVPPLGPDRDPSKMSRGEEHVVRDAFRRLLWACHDAGDAEKRKTVARPFAKFLKFMLDRDAKWKGHEGHVGKDYAELEKDYAKVRKLAGE